MKGKKFGPEAGHQNELNKCFCLNNRFFIKLIYCFSKIDGTRQHNFHV